MIQALMPMMYSSVYLYLFFSLYFACVSRGDRFSSLDYPIN